MVSGPSAFFSRKDKRAINFYTDHFNGIVAKRSADDTLAFRVEREMVNAASHFGKGISWTGAVALGQVRSACPVLAEKVRQSILRWRIWPKLS